MAHATKSALEIWAEAMAELARDARDPQEYKVSKARQLYKDERSLTGKDTEKQIRELCKSVTLALEDPNLTKEVELELFNQLDTLEAICLRLDFNAFMVSIGYWHERGLDL